MTREKIISGLQMTMDLIQFDPVTGIVRPIYTLNDIDKTTYVACKAAIEALKAQDVTDANVGDMISRQAAEKRIEESLSRAFVDVSGLGKNILKDVPSAQLPKGEWFRMSDLSEKDDDRYKCSRCGNVVHHESRVDLYTFNSWCGRCGSDNSRHTYRNENR